jgi:hypothetical protein
MPNNSNLAKQIFQHVSHQESELIALPCVHFATALLTLSQVYVQSMERTLRIVLHAVGGAYANTETPARRFH